ncbi:hypothetical protein BC477_04370 [Clavibacter michiganensis subsp. michiganensis]|uniref:Uncharacterized protein n=1 Tax=Clavibacter michiganensis subsp. michiganensis TaxID=33013 RepID=A0A251XKE8_CLAMM|nr:hypothetical protein BC477_04370 [Clavibacter michiganensis subsp. michiganensis]OUE03947.1 hypothetical protein CMMCAS07_03300 [Clavibacter michiganensis subsp. michiganensis]
MRSSSHSAETPRWMPFSTATRKSVSTPCSQARRRAVMPARRSSTADATSSTARLSAPASRAARATWSAPCP